MDDAAATGESVTFSSLLELLRRRLGGGSSPGELARALECAPVFFVVPAIALAFVDFADLAGARCLVLAEFPLSDFVGLRVVALEGDFSSLRALEGDSPLRGDFSAWRRGGFLRFGGIVGFDLLKVLRAEVRLSGMRNKAQLSKGGALSERSECGGCVFMEVGR